MYKLTEYERLVLIQDLLILKNQKELSLKLNQSDTGLKYEIEDIVEKITILENGYEQFYYKVYFPHISDLGTFPETESRFVLDYLDMLRAFIYAKQDGVDVSGIPDHFFEYIGFDRNNESQYAAFVDFYCEEGKEMYTESMSKGPKLNTHFPTVELRKKQVRAWKESVDKNKLTKEDMLRISSVNP